MLSAFMITNDAVINTFAHTPVPTFLHLSVALLGQTQAPGITSFPLISFARYKLPPETHGISIFSILSTFHTIKFADYFNLLYIK